jgi:hypothetical protein
LRLWRVVLAAGAITPGARGCSRDGHGAGTGTERERQPRFGLAAGVWCLVTWLLVAGYVLRGMSHKRQRGARSARQPPATAPPLLRDVDAGRYRCPGPWSGARRWSWTASYQLVSNLQWPPVATGACSRAVFGWGEAVRFFFAGSTWAPQVRLPPKFHSCECDFNALSGWVGGRRVRAPRGHLCITKWGWCGVTCVYVRSATL